MRGEELSEGKLAALNREVWEELDVKLDLEWGAHYVGGYQQSRARDGVMNDNFSAFVVKLANGAVRMATPIESGGNDRVVEQTARGHW